MRAKCFSDFRKSVVADLDAVTENDEPLIVTRRGKAPFVVIPLDMYETWQACLNSMGRVKAPNS